MELIFFGTKGGERNNSQFSARDLELNLSAVPLCSFFFSYSEEASLRHFCFEFSYCLSLISFFFLNSDSRVRIKILVSHEWGLIYLCTILFFSFLNSFSRVANSVFYLSNQNMILKHYSVFLVTSFSLLVCGIDNKITFCHWS